MSLFSKYNKLKQMSTIMEEKIHDHEKRISLQEAQQKEIMRQLTNHVPTRFDKLEHSVCELKNSFNEFRISQGKWIIGIFVSIVMLLLAVIVSMFVK